MFRTPKELKALLEAQCGNVSPSDLIRRPQYKSLKEIWCAVQFGLGYEKHVAICWIKANAEENSDTDFVMKTEKGEFPFQSTIADVPGRRMGDDHKVGLDGIPLPRPYEPGRGSIEGPRWIADAVKDKIERKYANPKGLSLLVYANFSAHEMEYESVCAEVQRLAGYFLSVWLITNHQICSLLSTSEIGDIRRFADIYNADELLTML